MKQPFIDAIPGLLMEDAGRHWACRVEFLGSPAGMSSAPSRPAVRPRIIPGVRESCIAP